MFFTSAYISPGCVSGVNGGFNRVVKDGNESMVLVSAG